jgi:hypothetical protein
MVVVEDQVVDAAGMSEFLVTPEDVIAASGRLSAIGTGVEELCGYVRGCAGAAAATPAEGAFDGMLAHFSSVLPHFGLAGDRLTQAVAGAGAGYQTSDMDIAGECSGGQGAATSDGG